MRRQMSEPSFVETVQIGIVVRDLETTMRRYVDEYGIGHGKHTNSQPGMPNAYTNMAADDRRSGKT